jgi:hypothetical protein
VVVVGRESVFRVAPDANGNWVAGTPRELPDSAVTAAADGEDVWVVTDREILRLDRELEIAARLSRSMLHKPLPSNAGIDPALPNRIVKIQYLTDQDPPGPLWMDPSRMWPFLRKGALHAVGGYGYVGADNAFSVVAGDGTMLSRLPLPGTPNHVLVRDGIAYLLVPNNRASELYRIDARNPRQPKLIEKRQMKETDGFAIMQWLDRAASVWFVMTYKFSIQPWLRLNGNHLSLHLIPLSGGEIQTKKLWARPSLGDRIYEMLSGRTSPTETMVPETKTPIWPVGSVLWRVTETVPAWGLLKTDTEMKLVRLGKGKDPAAIAAEWAVPGKPGPYAATGLSIDGSKIYVAIEENLYVLDGTGESPPTVVAHTNLPAPPVEVVVRR